MSIELVAAQAVAGLVTAAATNSSNRRDQDIDQQVQTILNREQSDNQNESLRAMQRLRGQQMRRIRENTDFLFNRLRG